MLWNHEIFSQVFKKYSFPIFRFKCNSMPNSLTNKPLNLSLPEDNRPTPMLWRLGGLLIPEPTIWMLISVWLVSLTLRDEGARSPRKFYLNSWRACKTMRTVRRSTISCTWPFQELVSLLIIRFVNHNVKCRVSCHFSGIGMDSSITPLRHGGLSLVQTTDFFYPLVEDPYMQGIISIITRLYNTDFYDFIGTLQKCLLVW